MIPVTTLVTCIGSWYSTWTILGLNGSKLGDRDILTTCKVRDHSVIIYMRTKIQYTVGGIYNLIVFNYDGNTGRRGSLLMDPISTLLLLS